MDRKKLLALVGMLGAPIQFATLVMPKIVAAVVILILGGFGPGPATVFPSGAVAGLLAAVVRGATNAFGVSLTSIVIGF